MICWGLFSCIYMWNQPPSFCGDILERLEVFIVPEKIYRTGIYARLSREDNEHGESNSISSQKAICKEYISRHPDLELVEIYDEDDGYSGTNMERPGFQRMLQDMRSGKIDCAISKDLSRFSRNYIEAGNYLEKIFPSLGIRYIAVNDCYDSLAPGSASDAITLPFKNLVNDIYCRDISVKIRTNLEVKRRKGEYVGSFAPYGYQKSTEDKNRLVVDDDAAEIVTMIFGMFKDGFPILRIAQRLNQSGVPTPMEHKRQQGVRFQTAFRRRDVPQWEYNTIARILKNEVYLGNLTQGKRGTPNHKVHDIRLKDEADWIHAEATHGALISPDDFMVVSELLKRDMRAADDSGQHYLFSGFLYCGDCKQGMVRKTVTRSEKKYIYYVCGKHRKEKNCSPHSFSENRLREVVFHAIHDQIETVMHLDQVLTFIERLPLENRKSFNYEAQIVKVEEEIERYRKLKLRLYEDLADGVITKSEYTEFRNAYTARIEEKSETVERLKKEQAQAATTGMTNRAWVQAFAQFQNISELDRRVLVALFTRTKRLRFNSNTGMNTSWRSAMSRNLKKGQLRLAEHRRIPWQEKVEKTAVSRNRQHRSGRCPMSLQSMHGCL